MAGIQERATSEAIAGDLEDDDYAWLSAALVAIAERHAGGRLVSTLEGGYSLTALRHAATVHCRALFGTTAP